MRALQKGLIVAFSGLVILSVPSALAASKLKTLYSFCSLPGCEDGANPQAALLRDSSGNLYGTAIAGNDNGHGLAFALIFNPAKQKYKYKVLYRFCQLLNCTDGLQPASNLIMDVNANLYGTTTGGGQFNGGTVFELVHKRQQTYKLKVLYSFCKQANCTDGSLPYEGLTYQGAETGTLYDGSSPLYGSTFHGGSATPAGVAYQLTLPDGAKKRKYKVIYMFCGLANCSDGGNPWGLTIDAAGNLYGNAEEGGTGSGVTFELSPHSGGFSQTVLYNFCSQAGCTDGENPTGIPAIDASGSLFGTTPSGGANGGSGIGTVWKLVPNGKNSQFTTLYNFCSEANCADGNEPIAGVTVAPDGDLFGTTEFGGQFCCGTVFKLHAGSETVLYSFCKDPDLGCPDGSTPFGGLILDETGILYGTTQVGGRGLEASGTVFALTP